MVLEILYFFVEVIILLIVRFFCVLELFIFLEYKNNFINFFMVMGLRFMKRSVFIFFIFLLNNYLFLVLNYFKYFDLI